MRGSEPESIGTDDLARRIGNLSDTARARLRGDYYSFGKKRFYALSSDDWTYEFDLTPTGGVWHERRSRNRDNWLLQCANKFDGQYVFGNRVDGKQYAIDVNTYTDAGETMVLRAQSQTVSFFPKRGKCNKLTVDVVIGEGSVLTDDVLSLEISIDGGANWIDLGPERLGRLGERSLRVQWRRLGEFSELGIIFALSCSADIARCIIDVDAEVVPLGR